MKRALFPGKNYHLGPENAVQRILAKVAIEARIGELLPSAEESRAIVGKKQKGIPKTARNGDTGSLPEGVNSKQAHAARTIANHPGGGRTISPCSSTSGD